MQPCWITSFIHEDIYIHIRSTYERVYDYFIILTSPLLNRFQFGISLILNNT